MEFQEIISLITLGAVCLGALVNVGTLITRREHKAANDAVIGVKLDNIYEKVDTMASKQGAMEILVGQHGERIKGCEESVASAHKRIDSLEKKRGA